MNTINIKQLIGNLIIVTTPECLNADLEAKVSEALLNVLQSANFQEPDNSNNNSQISQGAAEA